MATVQQILNFDLPDPAVAYRPSGAAPLKSDMSFGRGSAAWYPDQNNVIQKVASGEARVARPEQGLLLAPSATNLCVNGIAGENWSSRNSERIVADYADAPDGTPGGNDGSAVGVSLDTGGFTAVRPDFITLSDNTRYTISAWVKPDYNGPNVPGTEGYLDFGNGAAPNLIDRSTPVTGRWEKWYATYDTGTVSNPVKARFGRAVNKSTPEDWLVWGFQVETGHFPTTVKPTDGSTITVNRGSAGLPIGDSAQRAFTIVTEIVPLFDSLGVYFCGVGPIALNSRWNGVSEYDGSTHLRIEDSFNGRGVPIRCAYSADPQTRKIAANGRVRVDSNYNTSNTLIGSNNISINTYDPNKRGGAFLTKFVTVHHGLATNNELQIITSN